MVLSHFQGVFIDFINRTNNVRYIQVSLCNNLIKFFLQHDITERDYISILDDIHILILHTPSIHTCGFSTIMMITS